MRRSVFWLLAGVPSLLAAQGFGIYEHGTCTMGRAGVAAARPCADGSAIFFNPAGLAGLSGTRASAGVTLIHAFGGFTDDVFAQQTDLDNPTIPVPNAYFTYAVTPKVSVGLGGYAPYGLETRWPTDGFQGRFLGYNTKLSSIYVQPTIGYQVTDRIAVGAGFAYILSDVELHQRVDLSAQLVPDALRLAVTPPLPAGTRFGDLGIPTATDFANAALKADGTGFAVNFGAIVKLTDRLSIGGHWLTRKTIKYDGDVVFQQVATNLRLPVAIGPLPAGTPVDGIVAPQFGTGGPLSSGTASTEITMPPQGSIGFAYRVNDRWAVMADYHLVVWGWFNTLLLDFANPLTPDLTLSPRNDDTHGFRFGTEYQYSPKVTLRGGYLYHTGASPDEFVTPLLPEGQRNELTVGAGFTLTPALRADLAYQFIKQNDRRGRVHEAQVGNTGIYEFSAHLVGVGLAYTF